MQPLVKNYKYKAFISYSHQDERWAGWLHKTLETYRTPKHLAGKATDFGPIPASLTPVFRDRDELPTSPDLSQQIQSALEASENLIVICSPAAASSRWVDQEVRKFKQLGRSARIFCLIVDGDPGAEGTEQDCFSPALRQRYDEAGNPLDKKAEPIAADARRSADGKARARLKILAGLLGLGLDELRQRELQRRLRRMFAISIASTAATVVAIVLALNAFMARDEAQQRRQQAESLLEFMVVDLRDSLTPLGRLDLLEAVGERAMEYFSIIDLEDLTDDELLHQTRVITQIGEIRFEQLEYDDALASFMDAYKRSRILQASDPTDDNRLFNRGQAEFWVGYVHWMAGDRDESATWLNRYRTSSEELVEMDPANTTWQREVAYAHHNLGVLAIQAEEPEKAGYHFNQALALFADIQEAEGEHSLQAEIADAISYLGEIAERKGDLLAARDYYQRNTDALCTIVEDDPRNAERLYDLANANYLMALLEQRNLAWEKALDQSEQARSYIRKAIDSTAPTLLDRARLANIHLFRAQVFRELSAANRAQMALNSASSLLGESPPLLASHEVLDPWLRYLMLVGDVSAAVSLQNTLTERSYQPLVAWPDVRL